MRVEGRAVGEQAEKGANTQRKRKRKGNYRYGLARPKYRIHQLKCCARTGASKCSIVTDQAFVRARYAATTLLAWDKSGLSSC